MEKTIDSTSLYRMAQRCSSDLKMYHFGPFPELERYPPIAQGLFWAFLGVELAYKKGDISKEIRNKAANKLENSFQEVSFQIVSAQSQYEALEQKLVGILFQEKEPIEKAIPILMKMLDFEHSRSFEGKYSVMYEELSNRTNPCSDSSFEGVDLFDN